MASRSYWLDLFTPRTWGEFLAAGGNVTGFREGRWATVQRIEQGDYFLCYLTGVSRFVGVLEVTGDPYRDDTGSIWADDAFPCRLPVRTVAALSIETGVPIQRLADSLSMFANLTRPTAWTGAVRGSPSRWREADGEAVVAAVLRAVEEPVETPVDPRKVERANKRTLTLPPPTVPLPLPETSVLLPEPAPAIAEPSATFSAVEAAEAAEPVKEERAHTEIQWRLLKLGGDMGLDVWVARNDRSAAYHGQRLGDLPRTRDELPKQFEERTTRLIELIDVLWLRGDTIVAAFEIESTTSIYSGLLRMSDLLSLQPNVNIPLYLVAPDERRKKVGEELNRPTFNRLHPPLKSVCRYLAFSVIRDEFPTDVRWVRNLNPKFLDDYAEVLTHGGPS